MKNWILMEEDKLYFGILFFGVLNLCLGCALYDMAMIQKNYLGGVAAGGIFLALSTGQLSIFIKNSKRVKKDGV